MRWFKGERERKGGMEREEGEKEGEKEREREREQGREGEGERERGKEGIKHEGRERRAETKIISIDRPRQRG